MTSVRARVVCCWFVFIGSFALLTEPAKAQAFVSPYVGINYGGDARCPESDASCKEGNSTYGLAFGNINALIGFEEDLSYSKNLFKDRSIANSSVLTLMSNILIGPSIGYVRIYGAGGFGFMRLRKELTPASLITLTDSHIGWNIGGGLMISHGHVGVRGDIRVFHGLSDLVGFDLPGRDPRLDFSRAMVGLVIQ